MSKYPHTSGFRDDKGRPQRFKDLSYTQETAKNQFGSSTEINLCLIRTFPLKRKGHIYIFFLNFVDSDLGLQPWLLFSILATVERCLLCADIALDVGKSSRSGHPHSSVFQNKSIFGVMLS